jgi:hypothetical protein
MVRIPAYCGDVVALRCRARLGCMTAPTGRVLTFAAPDYQYGAGPLRPRVERIDRANPVRYDGENWYQVEGVQISGNGAELGRRQVLVRGRRLPS